MINIFIMLIISVLKVFEFFTYYLHTTTYIQY